MKGGVAPPHFPSWWYTHEIFTSQVSCTTCERLSASQLWLKSCRLQKSCAMDKVQIWCSGVSTTVCTTSNMIKNINKTAGSVLASCTWNNYDFCDRLWEKSFLRWCRTKCYQGARWMSYRRVDPSGSYNVCKVYRCTTIDSIRSFCRALIRNAPSATFRSVISSQDDFMFFHRARPVVIPLL